MNKNLKTLLLSEKPLILSFILLLTVSVAGISAHPQTVEGELRDYFYPSEKYSYMVTPDAEKPCLAVTYSLPRRNILQKVTHVYDGNTLNKVAEEIYNLKFDLKRQAIVSTQQYIQSLLGSRDESNLITLFILPKDNEEVTWTESNGDKYECSAKFVYISFFMEGKKVYRKAVKIEKTIVTPNSPTVKDWSYWVKDLSRIATYGYWGDPNKVSCVDKSFNIDLKSPVTEISKTLYDRYTKMSGWKGK